MIFLLLELMFEVWPKPWVAFDEAYVMVGKVISYSLGASVFVSQFSEPLLLALSILLVMLVRQPTIKLILCAIALMLLHFALITVLSIWSTTKSPLSFTFFSLPLAIIYLWVISSPLFQLTIDRFQRKKVAGVKLL